MAHFAQLNQDNIVTDVIVVNNDVIQDFPFPQSEPIGVAFCQSLFGANTIWAQTSYNGNFRGKYAGIGDLFDPSIGPYGLFIAPPSADSTYDSGEQAV